MARKSREKLSEKRSMKGYKEHAQSNQLLKLFAEIKDYRKPQGKRHKLEHIQKEQVKKLLGVEFSLTPKKSVVSEIYRSCRSSTL